MSVLIISGITSAFLSISSTGKSLAIVPKFIKTHKSETGYRYYVLPFNGRFFYLSAIQDLFNNEIVAYQISERNDLKLVLDTLDKLIKN